MTLFLEFCASLLQYYVSETLQFIASRLVSSYILFLSSVPRCACLAKLASIFVIIFQFEPATSIIRRSGILFIPYDFTANLTARGLILSSPWRVTHLWNFDIYQ